jgi:putative salt-induced outer membrane protein YdiY
MMLKRIILVTLLTVSIAPQALADQVYLKDRSVVSGEITGAYQDVLSIKTGFAGTLEINMSAIKGIQSDMPLITQLQSGDRIAGTLAYDQSEGQRIYSKNLGAMTVDVEAFSAMWQRNGVTPEIAALQEEKAKQVQEIEAMEQAHTEEVQTLKAEAESKAEDVWSGSLKFGFAGSDGNTEEMKFDGKAVAKRETDFDRLKLSLQGRFESDDGEETKNEIIGEAKLERDITERLFAFTSLTMEHDKFEEIDLRSNLTGGLGYFLIKEENHELKPRLGVGYEVTAYENDPTEKDIVLSAGYDYRIDMMDKVQFTHSFTYLPAFEDIADDYRLDSDAALLYPLDDDKSWNVELGLRNQYDSMPAADVKELDTYYSLGLSRKFE